MQHSLDRSVVMSALHWSATNAKFFWSLEKNYFSFVGRIMLMIIGSLYLTVCNAVRKFPLAKSTDQQIICVFFKALNFYFWWDWNHYLKVSYFWKANTLVLNLGNFQYPSGKDKAGEGQGHILNTQCNQNNRLSLNTKKDLSSYDFLHQNHRGGLSSSLASMSTRWPPCHPQELVVCTKIPNIKTG